MTHYHPTLTRYIMLNTKSKNCRWVTQCSASFRLLYTWHSKITVLSMRKYGASTNLSFYLEQLLQLNKIFTDLSKKYLSVDFKGVCRGLRMIFLYYQESSVYNRMFYMVQIPCSRRRKNTREFIYADLCYYFILRHTKDLWRYAELREQTNKGSRRIMSNCNIIRFIQT